MSIPNWIGDIHAIDGLPQPLTGLIVMMTSVLCGTLIGLERERRDKPAGLRTVVLICVGSTIYTIVSLLLASSKPMADPARLAAQIIPGIGFLGAGAIIRSRGSVVGLTTGATIWSVAAIGVTCGAGYVIPALVFTVAILLVLTVGHRMTVLVAGRCDFRDAAVVFQSDSGRSRCRLQTILDRHLIPDKASRYSPLDDGRIKLEVRMCLRHREHRALLHELAEVNGVVEVPNLH